MWPPVIHVNSWGSVEIQPRIVCVCVWGRGGHVPCLSGVPSSRLWVRNDEREEEDGWWGSAGMRRQADKEIVATAVEAAGGWRLPNCWCKSAGSECEFVCAGNSNAEATACGSKIVSLFIDHNSCGKTIYHTDSPPAVAWNMKSLASGFAGSLRFCVKDESGESP